MMIGPRYRIRLALFALMLVGASMLLIARLWTLQIDQRDHYVQMMPGSSTVTVRVPPTRGLIYDRNGRILANNSVNYEVNLNLDELRHAYEEETQQRAPTIEYEVARRDSVQTNRIPEADIVTIFKDFLVPRLESLDLARDFNASRMTVHYRTHRGLLPFRYADNLEYDEFARFAENATTLPGLSARFRPKREYPYGAMASHLLGYLRLPEAGDLPPDERHEFQHYFPDDVGVSGIEQGMNEFLRGRAGRRTIQRDGRGVILGEIGYDPPEPGADVYLTLDAEFQFLGEKLMRNVGRGAAVVLDVETGEIVAMVSVPSYDPNDFVPYISQSRYQSYMENPASPLLSAALGTYEPGSTYKMVLALAAGMTDKTSHVYNCVGGVRYGNHFKRCWIFSRGGSHGNLGLNDAIMRSCNSYFYLLANSLGQDPMVQAAEALGFGRGYQLEISGEDPGLVMGSRHWMDVVRQEPSRRMTAAEQANMAIGQGETLTSPLQIAVLSATIANGGRVLRPHLVSRVVAPNGKDILYPTMESDGRRPGEPEVLADFIQMGVSEEQMEILRQGMHDAVNRQGGTASRAALEAGAMSGKTGTSQTSIRGARGNHAWFTGFAPFEQPRYAVTVVVLGGEAGGLAAAPIAQKLMEGIFAIERDRIHSGLGWRPKLTALPAYPGHFDPISEVEFEGEGLEVTVRLAESAQPADIQPAIPIDQPTPEASLEILPDAEGIIVRRARPVEFQSEDNPGP